MLAWLNNVAYYHAWLNNAWLNNAWLNNAWLNNSWTNSGYSDAWLYVRSPYGAKVKHMSWTCGSAEHHLPRTKWATRTLSPDSVDADVWTTSPGELRLFTGGTPTL